MSASGLIGLTGIAAASMRSLGFEPVVRRARESLDALCAATGCLPLSVRVDGEIELCGLFRHRSFLASLAGSYEPLMRRLFLDALGCDAVVVDGGAHIGLYTLLAARRVGAAGHVLAFEPDPLNRAALCGNVRRLNPDNVTICAAALGARRGRAHFYLDYGTISGSLVRREPSARSATIAVTTIDHELAALALPALIVKLDLEGGEPAALRGMREALLRARRLVLFVEQNPAALHAAGTDARALHDQLVAMGLDVRFIDERAGRLLRWADAGARAKGNLFCTRVPR